MDMSFEDQIRERAYQIWQAGGMADGQAHEHWACAEQAVRGEVATVTAEPEVILTKAAPRKATATKAATARKTASVKAKTVKTKTVKAKEIAKGSAAKAPRVKAKTVAESAAL